MKLKLRLPLLMVGLILISITVLGILSYNTGSDIILDHEGEYFKRVVLDYQKTTDLVIDREKQIVLNMAKRTDFADLVKKSLWCENYNSFKKDNIDLLDKVKNELKQITDDRDNVEQIYLVNLNGNVVLDSIGNAIDMDFATNYPYFYDVVYNDEVFVSKNIKSLNTGNNVIHFAAPIKHPENNTIIGVMVNAVYSDSFFTELRKEKLGNTGFLYVIDKNGVILTHKDKEKVGKGIEIDALKNVVLSMRQGNNFYEPVLDEYNNGEVTFAYVQIPDLDWLVVAEENTQEFLAELDSLRNKVLFFGSIIAFLAILIGVWQSRIITRPLGLLQSAFNKVSEGYLLNTDIERKDEIGELAKSFNEMVNKQKELINLITKTGNELTDSSSSLASISQEVSSGAEQVSVSIDQVARGISDNAKDVEKTSNALYDVGEKVNEVMALINNMQNESIQIANLNDDGLNIVEKLQVTNNSSTKSAGEIAENIKKLDVKSTQIGNIVAAIDAISEQTNLLALNAAIEAARAGEAGRGFAVVADEIRKLAEQSSESTGEINDIILEIQKEINVVVGKMQEVIDAVNNETEVVIRVNEVFNQIHAAIQNIIKEINKVSGSMNEVITKRDNVVGYMNNVSAVTQEISASTEEIAATAQQQTASINEVANLVQSLNSLAEELTEIISFFKVDKDDEQEIVASGENIDLVETKDNKEEKKENQEDVVNGQEVIEEEKEYKEEKIN